MPSSVPHSHALASIIARHTTQDGDYSTAIRGLFLSHKSSPTQPLFTAQWPCLALVAQGQKSIALSSEVYHYGPGDYLVVSVDVPTRSRVTQATTKRPNLGIGMVIDPSRLRAVLDRANVPPPALAGEDLRGVSVNRASSELIEAVTRLVTLLDRPGEIPVMAPLIEEEILYRLLQGPCGPRLLHIAMVDSASNRVVKAIAWLRDNYAEPLRIEDLAKKVGMSLSSFHHHFKAITAMSPLQYQKQLRLHEARRLMLVEQMDAGSASFQVGYQSQSQFSREYTRLYGLSPQRDVLELRKGNRWTREDRRPTSAM